MYGHDIQSINELFIADRNTNWFTAKWPLFSYCLLVCLFVCAEFFSAVFDPISIKLGHMLYVWV